MAKTPVIYTKKAIFMCMAVYIIIYKTKPMAYNYSTCKYITPVIIVALIYLVGGNAAGAPCPNMSCKKIKTSLTVIDLIMCCPKMNVK